MPDSGAFNVKVGGDLAFLAKKEFDGKLSSVEGFLSVIGDLATITAAAGKDMYIARAKVIFYKNTVGAATSLADKVELQINGIAVETATFMHEAEDVTPEFGVGAWSYEFKNMGRKVAATQIIKLEVITLDADVDVEGFIEVWEEDTGVDPTL